MASLFLFFPLFFFVETPATETFLPKFPFLRPCNAVEDFGDEDDSDKFCVQVIRCWKILVDERANPSTCGIDDRRENKMDEDITLMFDWFNDEGGEGMKGLAGVVFSGLASYCIVVSVLVWWMVDRYTVLEDEGCERL